MLPELRKGEHCGWAMEEYKRFHLHKKVQKKSKALGAEKWILFYSVPQKTFPNINFWTVAV